MYMGVHMPLHTYAGQKTSWSQLSLHSTWDLRIELRLSVRVGGKPFYLLSHPTSMYSI